MTQTRTIQNKQVQITVCSWNIRRGLLIREEELKALIKTKGIDVFFLVETDSNTVNDESDYQIEGFKTLVQKKKEESDSTRIICLLRNTLARHTIIRDDLSSADFPSLWIELENESGKNVICAGFYREWSPKGDGSIQAQVKSIEIFTRQIEVATLEGKSILIMGDANLCNLKWDLPGFLHRKVSDELRGTLTQCGLSEVNLGITYTADRLAEDGSEITSAIDHVYLSQNLVNIVDSYKLDNSATDHLPIVTVVKVSKQLNTNTDNKKPIRKRSMKDFNQTRWIDCLRNRDWKKVTNLEDVNEKTMELTNQINQALDECAPYKLFKVRQNFKPGLSENAKKMIQERDLTRKNIASAKETDKPALKAKYRQLRNKTLSLIRNDTIRRNGERITNAKSEGETWKIINEIIKPKSGSDIVINGTDGEISDNQGVANAFNTFFIKKVEALKEKIDPELIKDPLDKIKTKLADKNLSFRLKTVTTTKVMKLMKKMAKKKSKGNDDIPQDCLLLGREALAGPLTDVINTSIKAGLFPDLWKEGIVVPILKKGNSKELKNYRPVSCLPAASKVLEAVVCEQLTRHAEVHQLLPNNQHGFRTQRSTMTALSAMQKEWIKNTEEGLTTGILVWDLSAAFDTLDISLFIKKMEIYGADKTTQDWFRSFLQNRTQRVRVGGALSSALGLESGVPQGGILSPIIFTLYTADMELWLNNSKLFNFADDTTTDTKGTVPLNIKRNLENDAVNILQFMASNGLVANQAKTEFLVLNDRDKKNTSLKEIRVGDVTVPRTTHTKLLGVIIEESQGWSRHLAGLEKSLNQRLFLIRRISRQIPHDKIIGIVHCLWMSKLRYGLQLCTKTRLLSTDKTQISLKSLQSTQNRMLRMLNGTTIKDKINSGILLEKFGLLSVNQLSAKIKLIEGWKIVHKENYPLTLEPYHTESNRDGQHSLRLQHNRVFWDSCKYVKSETSFHIDTAKLWNNAPSDVRNAPNLYAAKKNINVFCKTLPI